MNRGYRILAHLIAGLVVIQAGLVVFGDFGLNEWIDEGGVLDKAGVEAAMASGEIPFAGVYGYILHSVVGQYLIPLVAVALLVVSFFVKIPKGVGWAAGIFALVVLQVLFGLVAGPALGALHGVNALLLFAAALAAASRAKVTSTPGVRVATG